MEKPRTRKRHYSTVFIAGVYYRGVPYGAARLRNILYAAFLGAFDIIKKREKRVRPE